MADIALLVLAAGMGSRYGGLKQIDPIGPSGETLMDYSIYDAMRAGFNKVVFVIRKDIEEPFRQTIGLRYERSITVDYAFQELGKLPPGFAVPGGRTKPWGTTHAILMTPTLIHEPFAVVNADDFYGESGYRALAHHLQSGTADYAMVGYRLHDTLSEFGSVARGVCHVDQGGYLQQIVELKSIEPSGAHAKNTDPEQGETDLTGEELVSMNMWGFTPQIFPHLHEQFRHFLDLHGNDLKAECYIPTTVNDLIAEGKARVRVLPSTDSWFGVTYREDRPKAVESVRGLVQAGYYPGNLWS